MTSWLHALMIRIRVSQSVQFVATLSFSTELRWRVFNRCCMANMRARPLVIGSRKKQQRPTKALTTVSIRATTDCLTMGFSPLLSPGVILAKPTRQRHAGSSVGKPCRAVAVGIDSSIVDRWGKAFADALLGCRSDIVHACADYRDRRARRPGGRSRHAPTGGHGHCSRQPGRQWPDLFLPGDTAARRSWIRSKR